MVYPYGIYSPTNEGHFLLTIHYLVQGVSNTCLTGHFEILSVQQRALLLVGVCARSGRGGSAVSRLMFQKLAKTSTCNDEYVNWI